MVKSKLPIAGYIRVSRKGDREELRSPDFQAKAIERYCDAEGLAIELLPPEIDVSGSKSKRPILDAAIARIKAGELGGLVVAKLDRLSRMSPRDRVLLFEEVEDAGGVILSAGEQLDPSTPEGRFAREVFLGIARMQWEKYREGFETAKAEAIAAGIPVNTRAAVGYTKGDDHRLMSDPVAAPIVREVFERRAAGEGPAALGQFLTASGVKTSQGSATWSKQAVYGLLANRVYLGEVSYGNPPRFVNAQAHEPIVDLATWTAAQNPPRATRTARAGGKTEFLLTGLARCEGCGYSMQATTSSHSHRIYRCTRTHSGGVCPAPARVRADALETAIEAQFWQWASDVHSEPADQPDVDLAPLEHALALAERRVMQAMTPEVQDAAGEAWAAMIRERREERDAAAQELGQARAKAELPTRRPVVDTVSLERRWSTMAAVERRELLADVLWTDCIAVSAGPPRSAVVYQRGTEPADLPRRGFKPAPSLRPFPAELPPDATVVAV